MSSVAESEGTELEVVSPELDVRGALLTATLLATTAEEEGEEVVLTELEVLTEVDVLTVLDFVVLIELVLTELDVLTVLDFFAVLVVLEVVAVD